MATSTDRVGVFLARCRAAGVTLTAEGGQLIADAPDTKEASRLLDQLPLLKTQICGRLSKAHNSHNSQNSLAWIGSPLTKDPRKDLAEDSRLWGWALKLTAGYYGTDPGGSLEALHTVRCGGAALTYENNRLRIVPRCAPKQSIAADDGETLHLATDTDWSTPGEWEQTKAEVLAPHREAITDILRRVAEMIREDEQRAMVRAA